MTRRRAVKRHRYPCSAPICDLDTPDWTFFCDPHWAKLPRELKGPLIAKACVRNEDGSPSDVAVKHVRAAVEHLARDGGLIE